MVAICPEGDRDTYAVQITVEKAEPRGDHLVGLRVSRCPSRSSATVERPLAMVPRWGDKALRAYVANLPVGTYFVQAFAASGVKNNYNVAIKVTGP